MAPATVESQAYYGLGKINNTVDLSTVFLLQRVSPKIATLLDSNVVTRILGYESWWTVSTKRFNIILYNGFYSGINPLDSHSIY